MHRQSPFSYLRGKQTEETEQPRPTPLVWATT
jgi:hypothetical protein